MIEDEELRVLYEVSCEEHLQSLEAGILYLEQHPDDLGGIDDLLREAHSLKGDSRMLGVKDVETLSHEIEHLLGVIQRRERTIDESLSDRLYKGLDAIKQVVKEAVTGIPHRIDIFKTLAYMIGAEDQAPAAEAPPAETPPAIEQEVVEAPTPLAEVPPEIPPEVPAVEPVIQAVEPAIEAPQIPEPAIKPVAPVVVETKPPAIAEPAVHPPSGEGTYRINTIRVETRHLDGLMTQTGELTVTKIGIAHTASSIENLAQLWERYQANTQKQASRGQGKIAKSNDEQEFHNDLAKVITSLRSTSQENFARLESIAHKLEDQVRTLRLLPLSTIFQLFPRMVRDLSKTEQKEVELIIEGGETAVDKHILEEIKDPLMHLVRNAVDHGLESPEERLQNGKPRSGKLYLRGYQTATNVMIEVQDDGKGLDLERIKSTAIRRGLYTAESLASMTPIQIYRIILQPGFSTKQLVTEVSGRGVGLDVVNTNVEKLKGSIKIESTPNEGSKFTIQLGITLATANVLLFSVQEIVYALPTEFIRTTRLVNMDDLFTVEGRLTIAVEGEAIAISHLDELLELSPPDAANNASLNTNRCCIFLEIDGEKIGLLVDHLIDTQDVVIKPQNTLLQRVRNVSGATILGTGEVCMILNPHDILKTVQKSKQNTNAAPSFTASSSKPIILLVEDSITTRTKEKRILEGAGYQVITAVDGMDGFRKLQQAERVDGIISDVQMPNLDGLGLAKKVREQAQYADLPFILVTTLASPEDRRRGAEVGANAYIPKGEFNQEILISTLQRLL